MALVLPEDDPYIRFVFADEEPIRAAYWQPGPGETALDVGSHYGSYAIPALAAGADVIAVEPRPEFSGRMLEIMAANSISDARLTLVTEALAGPDGYSQEFWGHLAGGPCQDIYATRGMTFTTLDELTSRLELTRLDWVKIDVEGAELGVLQGGSQTLKRFRPRMLIEDHGGTLPFVLVMGIPLGVAVFLHDLGYHTEVIRHVTQTSSPDRDFWVVTPNPLLLTS
jgi:FkbM family methyltransferase